MTDLVGRTLDRLAARLPGRVSTPGDAGYAAATAIWSKPVGRMPRAVVHCGTADAALLKATRDAGAVAVGKPTPGGIVKANEYRPFSGSKLAARCDNS